MAVNPRRGVKGIALVFPFYFFLFNILHAQSNQALLIWDEENAIGISFPVDKPNIENISITLKDKETAILGRQTIESDKIVFYPIVPFTYDLSYKVKIDEQVVHEFYVPFPPNVKRSSVIKIFPSTQTIPANLLKIHIQFSQPMQEGKSKKYIHVLNENGDIIADIFLDLQPELWNEDRTSLTMWLDPGRIKRDLQPNLKMGPPLNVGLRYQLVISKNWRDQRGLELANDFVKEYQVMSDDRKKPNVNDWKITFPEADSKNDLAINFGETIDYELATNAIRVYKNGEIVEGSINVKDSESNWAFTPSNKWSPGKYEIVIESRLEDLAGNNLKRLFDHDLEKNDGRNNEQKFQKISFTLKEDSMQ